MIEWLNDHSVFTSEMVTKLGKVDFQGLFDHSREMLTTCRLLKGVEIKIISLG